MASWMDNEKTERRTDRLMSARLQMIRYMAKATRSEGKRDRERAIERGRWAKSLGGVKKGKERGARGEKRKKETYQERRGQSFQHRDTQYNSSHEVWISRRGLFVASNASFGHFHGRPRMGPSRSLCCRLKTKGAVEHLPTGGRIVDI